MTLRQAKQLKHGDVLECQVHKNANGTPQRWKVTGKVKTWKRDKNKVKVPIKRGLYEYGYITEFCMQYFELQK